MDEHETDPADALFGDIVALSGVERDALIASRGTGLDADSGDPVYWWIIRKSKNDAPHGKPRRMVYSWWALVHDPKTGRFRDEVSADEHQARWKRDGMVRAVQPLDITSV